jgi:antitoxin CptB
MPVPDEIRWRCRRGMLELDLLLNDFLEQYETLDDEQQSTFERILEYPDQTLFELLMGRMKPTDKDVVNVIKQIRSVS